MNLARSHRLSISARGAGAAIALASAVLLPRLAATLRAEGVVINEIHYAPPEKTLREEFVELHNAGDAGADLSGWYLADAVSYLFPPGTTLAPGAFLVVAENPESITRKFGPVRVLGPYSGYLNGDGETLSLRNAMGGKEDEVDYRAGFPWPVAPAGRGSSLELLNPSLDNELGGSWRASTSARTLPEERRCLLAAQDAGWHYRKGTSEASDPPSAWRALDFVEDETWLVGRTSIGFEDMDDNTILDDMLGNYTSIYLRHEFVFPAEETAPPALVLRVTVDDGCIVWVNGAEVARVRVTPGDRAYNDVARPGEARWEEHILTGVGAYLLPGRNMIAIHALNASLTSNDFSVDAELCIPARSELPPIPTPGAENSVYTTDAPPQIRQVGHAPQTPPSGAPFKVTATVTGPEGVTAVSLAYQIVRPGDFVPAFLALEPPALMANPLAPLPPNPAFEDPANWTTVPMTDDGTAGDETAGDDIWTGVIPAQANRTLVRYRLRAADASGAVTVPYPDDRSLNFAAFVHDGIPPYTTTRTTVRPEGVGYQYPPAVLESLPVYFLITRAADVARCVAYNGAWQIPKSNERARDAFNWEGAFVYEGVVHDHVRYRLRQANDRYGGGGKRSWRIRFNKGHYLQARDNYGRPYPTRWRTLNTGKMFDNKGVGNFGLTETLNDILWNLVEVPAPHMHTFHFRVVDGADEAPAGTTGQYYGDFWGMALAVEDYDPRFVEAHELPDGNLYKLKDGIFNGNDLRRNQGRFAVTTDEDFQNIRQRLRPTQTVEWLDNNVNYPRWYPYHTVVEAIRHYDFVPADSHSKNRSWFFEPFAANPLGLLWTLPHDHDASWGPNWNDGIDYSKQAIFAGGAPKAEFRRDYRNVVREFRDLIWTEEVVHAAIDDLAAFVLEFSRADRDRWRTAPGDAGSQDHGPLEAKVADMKRFAFVSWTGATGPAVPAGGRAAHLDRLAAAEGDAAALPATPVVVSTSPEGFPIDRLTFRASPFSDPQGDDTFGAMKWRLGEVRDPENAAFDRARPRPFEYAAVWESEVLAVQESDVRIPPSAVQPGRFYRVRARMMDATGRWSHWSAPVQFRAGEPVRPLPEREYMRVTEIMYNPVGGGDAEFIEIGNIGPVAVDLGAVRLAGGIEFAFGGSDVTSLAPGERAVVVKDSRAFSFFYDAAGMKVAGEYRGRLDNAGDEIILALGEYSVIQQFRYESTWYPDTNGEGYSLVTVAPAGPSEKWSSKDGWRPSADLLGSPGAAEPDDPAAGGPRLPSDFDGDGTLNLTDAVNLLSVLYLDSPPPLPCGEPAGEAGGAAAGGSTALLDANGDRRLNLTDAVHVLNYLYLNGAPPTLGTACRRIAGCPEACGG